MKGNLPDRVSNLIFQTSMLERKISEFLTELNKANKNPSLTCKEFEEKDFPFELFKLGTYISCVLIKIHLLDKASDRLMMMSLAVPIIQMTAALGPIVHSLLVNIQKIESLKEDIKEDIIESKTNEYFAIVKSTTDGLLAHAQKVISEAKTILFEEFEE